MRNMERKAKKPTSETEGKYRLKEQLWKQLNINEHRMKRGNNEKIRKKT